MRSAGLFYNRSLDYFINVNANAFEVNTRDYLLSRPRPKPRASEASSRAQRETEEMPNTVTDCSIIWICAGVIIFRDFELHSHIFRAICSVRYVDYKIVGRSSSVRAGVQSLDRNHPSVVRSKRNERRIDHRSSRYHQKSPVARSTPGREAVLFRDMKTKSTIARVTDEKYRNAVASWRL